MQSLWSGVKARAVCHRLLILSFPLVLNPVMEGERRERREGKRGKEQQALELLESKGLWAKPVPTSSELIDLPAYAGLREGAC